MQERIDSFHKESERHAAYPEQSTAHFEDVANITFDSASVIPQGTLNSNQEDRQVNPYDNNEVDNSIEENMSKII